MDKIDNGHHALCNDNPQHFDYSPGSDCTVQLLLDAVELDRLEAADRAMVAATGYHYNDSGDMLCDECQEYLPHHYSMCFRKAWEDLS